MSLYTPKIANPNDGELITLCKILETTSGANPAWDSITLGGYDAYGNPGTVVYSAAGKTICTLTLGYTSGNLTSVVRS